MQAIRRTEQVVVVFCVSEIGLASGSIAVVLGRSGCRADIVAAIGAEGDREVCRGVGGVVASPQGGTITTTSQTLPSH